MPTSESVRQAMLRFYELFSGGDPDAFGEQISTEEDAFVIGTDWDQWGTGRDTWIEAYRTQLDETPGIRFEAGERLCAYEDGAVGWAADQANVVLPDGTAVPARFTAVFHREGDGWKVVNVHVSFGVPDAKLEELLPLLLS